MRRKYLKRKGLLETIQLIFMEFLGKNKEMLKLKMLETAICGEQKLALEDFFQHIRFNNHNTYGITISPEKQEAIKELIRIHSEESNKKGEINVYLESLLYFITGSKRLSNDIIRTGIDFNAVPNNVKSPLFLAHTCFNYIDIKEELLVDLETKKRDEIIRESKLFEWLGPGLLSNPLSQTYSFVG
jgi:hypothetical protein